MTAEYHMAYVVFNLAGFVIEYQFQSKILLLLASLSSIFLRGGGFLAGLGLMVYGTLSLLQLGSIPVSKAVLSNGGEFVLFGIGSIVGAYLLALGVTELLWRLEN